MVLTSSDIENIVSFRATCRYHAALTDAFLQRRRDQILRTFIPDVAAFTDFLNNSNAVVSGSSALRLILAAADVTWDISDLDIYIPLSSGPDASAFFRRFGYSIIPYARPKTKYRCRKIRSVVAAVNGSRKIDIVVSCDGLPILPIFQFHSSVVMNYFTPTTIFCAYPALTLQFKGLINPMAFTRHQILPRRTLLALTKYAERGFEFASSGLAWSSSESHRCTQSLDCPLRARTSFDSACLSVSFSCPTLTPNTLVRRDREMFGWLLGGYHCRESERLFSPYVFYTPVRQM